MVYPIRVEGMLNMPHHRALAAALVLVLALWAGVAAAVEEEVLPELSRLGDAALTKLKAKYEKRRKRHAAKVPPLQKKLRKGTRLLAQEMYPLQAALQYELSEVEKYAAWIEEIDAEFQRRQLVEASVAEKKDAARAKLEAERKEERAARLKAQERRLREEESYRKKLALIDAELERRERVAIEEQANAESSRKWLYGGLAIGMLALAIGGVIAIVLLKRR